MKSKSTHIAVILGSLLLLNSCVTDSQATAGSETSNKSESAASAADLQTQQALRTLQAKETAEPIRNDSRWRQPKTIHMFLPKQMYPPQIADFESWLGESLGAEMVFMSTPTELQTNSSSIQALISFCQLPVEFPSLTWMQSIPAGVEGCAASKQFNNERVIVTNGAATSGPAIAEWVIGSMFMLQRHFPAYLQSQQKSEWIGFDANIIQPGYEVAGRSILIVGLGGIGKQIAWRAKGLGMKVVATRNSSREGPDYVDYVGLPDEMLKLAAEADVVVNSAPLTDKTRGLFNQEFFNAMPADALFINVGRGGSVVQTDLIEALKNGSIRAAALDVTEPEPLPKESELWQLSNVFITPHHSSLTHATGVRRWVFIRENLRRFVKGDKIYNLVDLNKGY